MYARALPRGTVHMVEKQDGKVLENTYEAVLLEEGWVFTERKTCSVWRRK